MKINSWIFSLSILGFFYGYYTHAQEFTMPFMRNLPQVTYYNPSVKPMCRFSLAIPSGFVGVSSNGFSYKDTGDQKEKMWKVDQNKLYNALNKKNYVDVNAQVDIFRFSLKINPRMYLTTNISGESRNRVFVPKEVYALVKDGNNPYLGQSINLNLGVESLTYINVGIGAGYSINHKLTIGARIKYIGGLTHITTNQAKATVTSSKSSIVIEPSGVDVRTSGVYERDYKDLIQSGSVSSVMSRFVSQGHRNRGLGFDLGATWQATERLSLGMSLVDIGFIKWKHQTYQYRVKPSVGRYEFQGIDAAELIAGSASITEIFDDMKEKLGFNDPETRSGYTSMLPLKTYINGTYSLSSNSRAGVLFFAEYFQQRFMPAVSVSLNRDFGRHFSSSLSYTVVSQSYDNIGLGMEFHLSPIQLFVVGDNILASAVAVAREDLNSYINNVHFFTLRAGMNIVLQWDKSSDKLPAPR